MARAIVVLAAVLLALVAGCASHPPSGSYEATGAAPGIALEATRAAERVHAALARDFGGAPSGTFSLCLYRERSAFEAAIPARLRALGVVGHCEPDRARIYWPDRTHGLDTLAHELVHRFAASRLPGLAWWREEGLARALAPRREGQEDALALAARLSEAELRADLRSLATLPEGERFARRASVAAALVRFGLETGGWPDLAPIAAWEPDRERFVAWIREGKHAPGRFPPVLER